ncbi:MAG: helix-turn-helix transcriptional regulator [Cyclobacteriaceae bacterium]|nr:helix-turn-helix transcriptional regulator [Cyclobacteriaceae bacterium]
MSNSFQKILGYELSNILCNGNFSSKIIHPHDKTIFKEYLKTVPTSCNELSYFNNQYIVKQTKIRARHIRGYWKYLIIFSMDYWNSNTNTIDKIGLIADERTKPQIHVISRNRDHFQINTFISDGNSNSNGLNEINVKISPRESEILEFISEGMIAKEIATKLNISLSTVITHRKNIISKFNVHNTAELIKKATKLMFI